jgi:tRNA threonylcarbamoyladenosine biosynthesis protein TsaB
MEPIEIRVDSPLRILAVDTSTSTGGVAILEDDRIVAEWILSSKETHNRRLLGTLDCVLSKVGCSINDVDCFAVTVGPGSFTGLRIGLSTVKALAWVLDKAYVGIPSLDALAAPLGFAALPVCALIDARKNEVYCGRYRSDGAGSLQLVGSYLAVSPHEAIDGIAEPTLFCGDGWLLYRDVIQDKLATMAVAAPGVFNTIRAAHVGELAFQKILSGNTHDPVTSTPLYIRPSEAEIKNPHLSRQFYR